MYKYIGKGKYVIGLPARDITDDELKRRGFTEDFMKNYTDVFEKVKKVSKKEPVEVEQVAGEDK